MPRHAPPGSQDRKESQDLHKLRGVGVLALLGNLRRHEPDLNADKHELEEHELIRAGRSSTRTDRGRGAQVRCPDYVLVYRIPGALGIKWSALFLDSLLVVPVNWYIQWSEPNGIRRLPCGGGSLWRLRYMPRFPTILILRRLQPRGLGPRSGRRLLWRGRQPNPQPVLGRLLTSLQVGKPTGRESVATSKERSGLYDIVYDEVWAI